MKVTYTKIPDVNKENIETSKIKLADKILKNVNPLLDQISTEKNNSVNMLKESIKNKQNNILKNKKELELNLKKYNKNSKIQKLIERISKLISHGLIHDSILKHEMVILLKVIDTMDEEKLDYNLKKTLNILSKKFTK